MKCLFCHKKIVFACKAKEATQKYCSRACHYKQRTVLADLKKYFCHSCGVEVKERLSKRWVCRTCKRLKENRYYHGIGRERSLLRARIYYKNNVERIAVAVRNRWIRRNKFLRDEAIKKYGNKCACCGEARNEFICIDHINGGGGIHRRAIKKSIYLWLKQENYPKGFRLLCANCNSSLGHYGYCPHNEK